MADEPLRILAVDDTRENLLALEAALEQPGVELVTASSGFEALELLLRQEFALALLDVQMPDMDGFELAELMRGAERTRGVPIIFLTAIATDERRRFRGFETGAVDYLSKPIDIMVLNSKVAVFVELARQRREIAFQRDELGAALGRLHAHGDNSPLAVFEIDSDLRIVSWYRGAERTLGYTADEVLGAPLALAPFLPPDGGRETLLQGMIDLLQGGDRRAMQEHRYRHADGTLRDGEWYCSSLASTGQRAGSVMVEMLDITERRRAEETQRLLIGELNHRVKNTLATVQAIASQGFRHARSHDEFQDAFTGRLQALSRAHSMLSATTWESAGLRRLIADQVAIGALSEDRLLLDGADIDLPPELALRFSLVFHELATNAHKYGAFSNAVGTVSLMWSTRDGMLSMEWSEQGGPPVSPPTRRGFGSTLIEHSMTADGAQIVGEFAPEGVRWSMAMPLPQGAVPGGQNSVPASQPSTAQFSTDQSPTAQSSQAQSAPGVMHGEGLPPMRVLVVEDEPLVALELITEIEDAGAIAIGPATSCEQAMAMIREADPDIALLDGNLNGDRIDPVADALCARETPFAFVSGYDREHLPARHERRPMLNKPFIAADVRAILAHLTKEAAAPVG